MCYGWIENRFTVSLLCSGSFDVMMDGDSAAAGYVEYLQKNFLPDEAVYKPKKKVKKEPKGLENFYDDKDVQINEDSTNN